MAYSSTKPTITEKYHIEVPTHEYYVYGVVYKVHFGSRYFIGKGKSLMQSVQNMATTIERALRTGVIDETNMFYHVVSYIKKARVMRGSVSVLHVDSFEKNEAEMLKLEQEWLDKSKNDPKCLNNNFDAYIAQWIPAQQVYKFNQWKDERNKKNSNKSRAANKRKNKPNGVMDSKSRGKLPTRVRPKKAK